MRYLRKRKERHRKRKKRGLVYKEREPRVTIMILEFFINNTKPALNILYPPPA